jgi:predicted alpha/beta-fold hydrolase
VAGARAARTLRDWDHAVTAPLHGFTSAEDYYARSSAGPFLPSVKRPLLIVAAEDDPFVPPEPFRQPAVTGNPYVQVELFPHGGHCGFVGSKGPEYDGYWAEARIVEFAESVRGKRWAAGTDNEWPPARSSTLSPA